MKVCAFTIVKNAIKYQYPIVESITSALPLVDKFFVALDKGEDDTNEQIKKINSDKVHITITKWPISLTKDLIESLFLSTETNKCFDKIPAEYDWVIYLQADEVLHEDDYTKLLKLMNKHKDNKQVDGFLLNYYHFWGNFDYIMFGRHAYRRAVRILRNDKNIRSIRDALSFSKRNGDKLCVVETDCYVYHYGWVRSPKLMQEKTENMAWTGIDAEGEFSYSKHYKAVKFFRKTHPKVMEDFQKKINWDVNINPLISNVKGKNGLLNWFEQKTGHRLFESQQFIIYKAGKRWTNIWDKPLF